MGHFEILGLFDSDKWNSYLLRLPQEKQDIYFTPEYYSLYEERGEGIAQCFVFEKEGEVAIYPFLKDSINELGFSLDKQFFDIQGAYGYNGVLCSTDNLEFLQDFNEAFCSFCKSECIIAEFTRFHPLLQNQSNSARNMLVIMDRETVMIDLRNSYGEIWTNQYSSKNRNMVRKAQNLGYELQPIENPCEEDINVFIDTYNSSMDAVNAEKYYYFNSNFFYNTFNSLKEHALLCNVLDSEGTVVCSSIFFHFGNYFHYHLSGRVACADNSVNSFLIDRTIVYAQNKGVKYFHLGGGRSRLVDDSLFKFKKSFSKQTSPFYIGKKIHNTEIYNEVVRQWEQLFPEKIEKYSNLLLKYRY